MARMAGRQLGQRPVMPIGRADDHAVEALGQQGLSRIEPAYVKALGKGMPARGILISDAKQLYVGDGAQTRGVGIGVAVSGAQYADTNHGASSNVATSTGRPVRSDSSAARATCSAASASSGVIRKADPLSSASRTCLNSRKYGSSCSGAPLPRMGGLA